MIEAMIASRSAVKRPKMGFNMPKKHVLAISAVVVVAVAAAWLLPGRSKAPTTGAPANEQAQLPLGEGSPQPNGGAPSVEFAGNSQPMPLPLVGNSQPVMRGPLAEAAGGITEGDDGVPVEGSSATPPTVTTVAPPAGVQPGPAPTPAAKPVPAPTQVATAKPAPAAPAAKPVPAPAKVAVVAAAAKPAPAAKAAGGTWYAGQPTSNYVVQILGTSSETSAQNFVKEQGGEYRYFKKVLNGKPLYVITYGNFASRDAAVTAIKALPAKVQAGKPWPRTVASVQQELATTR
jgi:DamX protein